MAVTLELSKKTGEVYLCTLTSPDGLVTKELSIGNDGILILDSLPLGSGTNDYGFRAYPGSGQTISPNLNPKKLLNLSVPATT